MSDRYFDPIFIQRNTWIYLGGILLISLIYTNINRPYTWGEYLGYVAMLSIAYFPVLWFTWHQRQIKAKFSRRRYLAAWGLAHMGYPFFLVLCQNAHQFVDLPSVDGQRILISIGAVGQFCIALLLEINAFLDKKVRAMSWLKKIGLEKSILMLLLLLAVNIGLVATLDIQPLKRGPMEIEMDAIYFVPQLVSNVMQIFICFLSLYFFYFVNHYVLIPKLLRQRGLLIYAAGMISTIVLFYPFFAQVIALFPLNQQGWQLLPDQRLQVFREVHGLVPFILMVISLPIIMVIQWFKQSHQIVSLEKQQTVTELSLLKQQVNPHFFFNTLNNLYALSLKKSEQTPEVIMQLAELMRYVIYKGKESRVPLKSEIKYLKDYIRLQQIRLHQQLDLRFTTSVDNKELLFPPLLFIILVENAFKHGIEPAEHPAYLHIQLDCHDDQLVFICENSLEEQEHKKRGIGLENLRRRLELLFPDRHKLSILESARFFRVQLFLDLEPQAQKSLASSELTV